MKKETIDFPMFCTRQITLAKWFERLHIIKIVDYADIKHPITERFCMKVLRVETPSFLSTKVFDAVYNFIDEDGKKNRDELVRIGYITHHTKV